MSIHQVPAGTNAVHSLSLSHWFGQEADCPCRAVPSHFRALQRKEGLLLRTLWRCHSRQLVVPKGRLIPPLTNVRTFSHLVSEHPPKAQSGEPCQGVMQPGGKDLPHRDLSTSLASSQGCIEQGAFRAFWASRITAISKCLATPRPYILFPPFPKIRTDLCQENFYLINLRFKARSLYIKRQQGENGFVIKMSFRYYN